MKTQRHSNVTLRIGVLSLLIFLFALSACGMPTRTEAPPELKTIELISEPVIVDPLPVSALAAEPVVEAPVIVAEPVIEAAPAIIEEPMMAEVVAVDAPVVEAPVAEAPVAEVAAAIEVVEAEAVQNVAEVVEKTPAPMIAAPKTNALNPDAPVGGYYKGFLTDANGQGHDVTLALLPNGNVRWRVDQHYGVETKVMIGSWETGADTVTIRISGAENSDESIIEKYVLNKEGFTLRTADAGVTLYRFQALAFNAMSPAYDVIAATDIIRGASFSGTYKAMVPAMDAPGRDVTLVLKSDGSFEWTAFRLNSDKPEIELGSWVAGENDTVTLTVTGTPDREYRNAKEVAFVLTNGVLHNAGKQTTLYALPELVAPHSSVAMNVDG